jgi:hypothetical protein
MPKNIFTTIEHLDPATRKYMVGLLKRISAKILGPYFGSSYEGSAVFLATVLPRLGNTLDKYEAKALKLSRKFLMNCMEDAVASVDGSRLRLVAGALDEAKRRLDTGDFGRPQGRTLMLSMFYAGAQARNGEPIERHGLIAFLKKRGVPIKERQATNILRDLHLPSKLGRRRKTKGKSRQ